MPRPTPYAGQILLLIGIVTIVAITTIWVTTPPGAEHNQQLSLQDVRGSIDENIAGAATITTCGIADELDACCTALSNAVRGEPVDFSRLPMGGADASQMFLSGGSQNIPTMCRAARYVSEGDPAWLDSYFDYQVQNGFMANEVLSPVYGTNFIASEIFVIYHEAGRRGHTGLQKKARDWLRTFYALNALAAQPVKMKTYTAQVAGRPVVKPANSKCPITVAAAGTRSRDDSYSGAPGALILTGALGRATKRCGYNAGNYMAIASGKDLSKPVPASVFGITDAERAALNDLVNNGGSLDQVIAMTSGMKPLRTPITFIRTTEGSMSYFGSAADPNRDGRSISGNKPATYAARVLRTGELRTLWPDKKIIGSCTSCPSGREGDSAIATVGTLTDTLPFPGGTIQYIVEWSPQRGAWVVQRSGTISQPAGGTTPPPNGCVDSDSGAKPLRRGAASVDGVAVLTDTCASASVLSEAVCINGQPSTTTLNCPAGTTCRSGVCKTARLPKNGPDI